MTVRVVTIEDHVMMRELLREGIDHEPGLAVVGEFGSYDVAKSKLGKLAPDIVLLDLGLPGTPGVEAAREIHRQWPNYKILIFTEARDLKTVLSLFAAHADGYVLKNESVERLVDKIWMCHRGDAALSQEIINLIVKARQTMLLPESAFKALSPLEGRLLDEFATGSDYKRVCELFGIAVDTLKNHVKRIKNKLLADSTPQAVFTRNQTAF